MIDPKGKSKEVRSEGRTQVNKKKGGEKQKVPRSVKQNERGGSFIQHGRVRLQSEQTERLSSEGNILLFLDSWSLCVKLKNSRGVGGVIEVV